MTVAVVTSQTGAETFATVSGDLGLSVLDGEPAEICVTPAGAPLTGLVRRVRAAAVRIFNRVRFAAARSDVVLGVYVTRLRRASSYRPRHAAQRHWFGVQRSTSRRNAARVVASRAAAQEGELPGDRYPPEFISWLASFAEGVRANERALRQPTGRHFICS